MCLFGSYESLQHFKGIYESFHLARNGAHVYESNQTWPSNHLGINKDADDVCATRVKHGVD